MAKPILSYSSVIAKKFNPWRAISLFLVALNIVISFCAIQLKSPTIVTCTDKILIATIGVVIAFFARGQSNLNQWLAAIGFLVNFFMLMFLIVALIFHNLGIVKSAQTNPA